MADKSTHFLESLDFHPCDTPFNMDYFDLSCLTPTQQYSLNNHKVKVVREHQKYLNKNPEIRAVLQIIMRKLLLERPTHDINQFIGKYFSENWQDILDEVAKYVEKMPFATSGEPSSEKDMTSEIKQVTIKELRSRGSSKTSSPGVTEDGLITNVIKDLLEELLEDVYESVLGVSMENVYFFSLIRYNKPSKTK
ncbi:hypothetical protein ABEB36_002801 [Hypothenemus hampei]|uniref:Uncharacterized protein n=1 Tax=Hypothenemus hampei TaxID=57062 RepID=A0ABD1FA45_HYPHA